MLHRISRVRGFHLHASDGPIGHVDDVLIDPVTWQVRYLIVDTSNWIGGRAVVIAPGAIRAIDWGKGRIDLGLTRAEIERSPTLENMDVPPSDIWPQTAFIF